jgi:hypothetical protein
MVSHIKTTNLTAASIPGKGASWHDISLFALSFDIAECNPYKLNEIDSICELNSMSLTCLRAYLYRFQRRINNLSGPIDQEMMVFVDCILDRIRDIVK